MITEDELLSDPWPTYPVSKEDLFQLLNCWQRVNNWYLENPDAIQINWINDNPDGSIDCEFTLGSRAAQKLIKEGLITVLTRAANELEVKDD